MNISKALSNALRFLAVSCSYKASQFITLCGCGNFQKLPLLISPGKIFSSLEFESYPRYCFVPFARLLLWRETRRVFSWMQIKTVITHTAFIVDCTFYS